VIGAGILEVWLTEERTLTEKSNKMRTENLARWRLVIQQDNFQRNYENTISEKRER
jgi:hypothetical protein